MGSHNMLREVGVGESGFEFVAAGGVVLVEAKGPKQTNEQTNQKKFGGLCRRATPTEKQ